MVCQIGTRTPKLPRVGVNGVGRHSRVGTDIGIGVVASARSGQSRHNTQPDHLGGRQFLSSTAPQRARAGYSARMQTIELWFFTIADPQTGKRRRTHYRLTIEEARARYVDPEPVPNSLEVREVSDRAQGYGQVLGAKTKG